MGFSIDGFSVENDVFQFLETSSPGRPGMFPLFHSFVARRRFAGTSTLKMTRSSVRGCLFKVGPADPVRTVGTKKKNLQGVFCFLIWLVVNQAL